MKTNKNIWLIPTENKTRLFKDHDGFYTGKNHQTGHSINSSVTGIDVYITNDEKIEADDYYIDALTNFVHKAGATPVTMKCFKKIILTTDVSIDIIQNVPFKFLDWFCEESNKIGKPIEFIEVTKLEENNNFSYVVVVPEEKPSWVKALASPSGDLYITTFNSVSKLNQDGTKTDITENPESWFKLETDNDDYSISDESVDTEETKKPLYGSYFMDNLKEIASNLVDRETNASLESPYRKALEKYVSIGLEWQQKQQLDDMQYYMEYCQRNGYVTPQEWLNNHKHY